MTFVRIVPAAAALLLALASPAAAQSWPGQQNQSSNSSASQSPWPDQNKASSQSSWPNQPAAAAPWPGQSDSATHPAWGGKATAAVPAGPGQQQASRGQPPCADEFIPLRDDAQKKGKALQTTVDKNKTDRAKICAAFKTFVSAEAKVVKFVKDNGERCGIPDDAAKVMRANHSKSVTMRNRVCSASAAPSGPPPPSLSDALGTSSRLPDASSTRESKGGTFNTLSGNALSR